MEKKKVSKEDLKKLKGKGKGFFEEFKSFILRGNVMDMAIGVIIGTAFAGIVTSLTTNIINPLINGIGGAEIGGTFKIYGGQVIRYGDFITAIINFLIMAFVLFCLLKFVNKLTSVGKKKDEEAETVAPDPQLELLKEIRDELKKQKK